ncbi:MAG: hypothetical protein QOJ50_1909 [Cryptosporangiaceae bacterium]|jgi:phage/plasmid-like protein (TIGR03299 family)|nr:hypothetical protein [Cryptosporangiaceae bacterium]
MTTTLPTASTGSGAGADVNAAFAAERSAQYQAARDAQAGIDARVAAGTLSPLGGGRYRVTDPGSWDNGEVLRLQGGQLLPQHGLDMTTGTAALYTSTPAWHGLGTVIPGGISSVDRVLQLGGIDFEVTRRPVLYRPAAPAAASTDTNSADAASADGGRAEVLPGQFVTVREDTGAGLGVVGARYEVLQNRAVFEFLQDLVDDHGVVWESAGATRDGRRVFVSMRLPHTVTIDAAGISDEIVPFIAAINSHDGSSQAQVVVTPWRPLCSNTERFAVRDAFTRWGVRHTRNAADKVAEARRTLGLSISYFEKFAAEEEALARTDLAIAEFHQMLDELWEPPAEDASTRTRNHHASRTAVLEQLYRDNAERLGNTAYCAERAVTEYADWKTGIRPTGSLRGNNLAARATAVIEGTHDDIKSRAHRQLLTLTRR